MIGGILLLAANYAGYVTYPYYYEYSVSLWDGPGDFLLLFPLAAFLLYAAYVSLRGLLAGETPLPRRMFNYALYAAVFACVYSFLVGGVLLLIAESWSEELNDWWLDAGFYGGSVGGGLTALLLWLVLRSEKTALRDGRLP